jgi:hypothetical protein
MDNFSIYFRELILLLLYIIKIDVVTFCYPGRVIPSGYIPGFHAKLFQEILVE